MKKAKFGSKKSLKAVKPQRVAGVKVRSGVKAGRFGGESEFGRGGRDTDIPGRIG